MWRGRQCPWMPKHGTTPLGASRVYISTISGGPAVTGNSNRAIKSYAQAYRLGATEVMTMGRIESPSARPSKYTESVAFFQGDMTGVTFPHHDPLVITAEIAHYEVARVFLDRGSSVNIIFLDAFRQLGVHEGLLDRCCPTLVAFGGGHVQPLSHMHMTLSIGVYPRQTSITTNFVVAECPSSYNVILGCPAIGDLNLSKT
ncbi:unnamed protein product [Prunus armeniaca]